MCTWGGSVAHSTDEQPQMAVAKLCIFHCTLSLRDWLLVVSVGLLIGRDKSSSRKEGKRDEKEKEEVSVLRD